MGYQNVLHYAGGLEDWKNRGRPLVGGESQPAPAVRQVIPILLLDWIDRFPVRYWLGGWCLMIFLCAILFWLLSAWPGNGLLIAGQPATGDWSELPTAGYFSVVTATTLGYGDVVPLGMARILAVAEAAAGMLIFGGLIAKILSHRQEQLIQQIHPALPLFL